MSAILYAAASAGCLWIAHRLLVPLGRRTAILLALLPLLLTGPALLTGSVYAPVDLPYMASPLREERPEYGIDRIHNGTLSDLYTQIIPWKKAAREAWLGGEWPLWNPYLYAGDILAASAQSSPWEPFQLLSMLIPFPDALTFLAAIHLFLGGLWMFCWLREIGSREEGSLFGAAVWMFGDFMVFFLEWPLGVTFRWLPLILLGVRRVVRRRDWSSTLLLACGFALAIFAGHPESVLHLVAIGAIYGVWELATVRPPGVTRVVSRAVLAGALALGATAVFLLPITEALPQTMQHFHRSEVFARAKRSVPPAIAGARLVTNVVPFRYGWAREEMIPAAPAHPLPVTSYPGSLVFPIAMLGLWRSRAPERWLMLGLLLFGWLAGVDAPVVGDLLAKLPLFDIAINDRLVAAALLALATLAAFGVDAWMELADNRLPARLTLGALVLLGGAVAAMWPAMREGGLSAAFLARESGFHLVPLALAALALLLAKLPREGFVLLMLLFLGQRALEIGDEVPTVARRAFYPPFDGLELLPREGEPWRVAGQYFTLIPQTPAMYGLQDVRGYQAMTHREFAETIPIWSTEQPVSFNVVTDLTSPFVRFLNVRWAIAPPDRRFAPEGWRLVSEPKGMTLLEIERPIGRAFVPARVRINIPPPLVLEEMREERDFGVRSWIAHPSGGAAPGEIENGPGTVRVTTRGMSGLDLDVEMERAGWVVVSQVAWDGWHAYDDGRRIPLRRANHAFLGFHLEPGTHHVELRYDPLSFRWGGIISLLTIAGAAAFTIVRRRRRPTTPGLQ
ncbi:MAG TPA: YfhO family protein [Thermoanaerobaculia bacterium]|nr:YfhO family protein [Thermoanaerobaculia bacterium]